MWTGKNALGSIDRALDEMRKQVRDLDEVIQTTSTDLVELAQARGERFKRLAEVRLDSISGGVVVKGLDEADRRVKEILQERARQLASLKEQIAAAEEERVELEARREAQREQVGETAERLDRAEAATQRRLESDAEHRAQLEAARRVDAVAERAEEKTEQALRDRAQKGAPYESDPLFMYLWRRGFGTSDYAANSLTRALDGWVAKLCGYRDARPNYAMLVQIPERLGEHARRLRAAADGEFEQLERLEKAARAADGIPEGQAELGRAQAALDQIDARIAEHEATFRSLMGQRQTYVAGRDDTFQRAVGTLVEEFERDKLPSLLRQAKATPAAEDDVLVHELIDMEHREQELREVLVEHRRMHERALDRLGELEAVRQRFKRERYDDVHSGFANQGLIAMVLKEFLRGVASSDDLWGSIRRNQNYEPIESNPDFGTGSLRRRGGGSWHFPFPKGGRGGGGLGGGGGFRTGGGF